MSSEVLKFVKFNRIKGYEVADNYFSCRDRCRNPNAKTAALSDRG